MPKSISKFFCETYVLAKQTKQIPKSPPTRALIPGERIYIDLVGQITPIGYDGSKYVLLLTDNASCTTTGVLLKNKNQVEVELSKYTKRMHIQYEIIILAFCSNNREEYINRELQLCAS